MAWEAFQRNLDRANRYVGKRRIWVAPLLKVATATGMVASYIRQKHTFRKIRARARDRGSN